MPEAKLQAFQNADGLQPTKNFSKRKNLSRTEQCFVSGTAMKVNDRHLSQPVHCELNHHTPCFQ